MKKRIIALLTVAVMVVSLFVGCSPNSSKGKTKISVGYWPAKSGVELDNMEARKARFESENPDVEIEPDTWTFDLKTFYPKAEAGMLPTIFRTYFTEVLQILDNGYAADLTDALKKHGFEGKFNPTVINLASKDGRIYGIPFSSYVLGLAYNTDMFKKAGLLAEDGTPEQPKDWNELAEFAVKIKESTGKPGFVFPTTGTGGWLFTNLAWSFGVDFMEKDASGKWKATFDSDEAAEALQFIKDLKWKYDVLPSATIIDSAEYYRSFAVGNAAMCITSGAGIPPQVVKYDMDPDCLGMMALPSGPAGNVSLLGGGIYYVKADATEAEIDAAVRWIKDEVNFEVTDSYIETNESKIKEQLKNNQLVGIDSLSFWKNDVETLSFIRNLSRENANSNYNHVRLHNEYIANPKLNVRPEEPVEAQALYDILGNCIQRVLNDKNADCKEVLKKANSDFQMNYLNKIDY